MLFPKPSRQRKRGKNLKELNREIHERDDYTCIIKGCGRHVALGEKFHHEPCGSNKQDRIECGCLLCNEHHWERHNGDNGAEIRKKCEDYLSGLYPDENIFRSVTS